ncbi:hypothetical protein DFH11DRAFT_1690999 [Phellopilus nigrolimitatus]|nr:hypothetical protein DFH11DRAFT_1690999 [Phellopilus nigrolimitatus]
MFSHSFIAAIVALPLLAKTVFAADCARSYTVVQGDVCDGISAAKNASTYQLAAINPALDSTCSNLQPGQSLCLGTAGEDCSTTYVVKSEDTCDNILSAHGINSTLLWANNPNIDSGCSNIYIGEVSDLNGRPFVCSIHLTPFPTVPPVPASGIPATAIPTTAVNPTSAPSATATDNGDDDDDNLPWCDEL